MTTNHTPGPWSAEWADGHKLAIVIGAGTGLITHVNYCGPEDVENARLIAAAPDLLAALLACVALVDETWKGCERPELIDARAVLAKVQA